MIIGERLRRSVIQRQDEVFVRTEFARFGSPAQVSRGLDYLIKRGILVKLGKGVYAKAKPSVLSGNAIPVSPVEVLAPIALKKLGVEIKPSRATLNYNRGDSPQIPAGTVLNTGKRRISRKLGFGSQVIQYENAHS
jgi:hypothetical protein